MIIIWI